MNTNVPTSPEREVRVVVREDNSAEHHHSFKTRATKESSIHLEALVWFEQAFGGIRAQDAQVIIVNKKELHLENE